MCVWVKVCPISKPCFLPSKETKASAGRWNGVEWWILHTRCLESCREGEVPLSKNSSYFLTGTWHWPRKYVTKYWVNHSILPQWRVRKSMDKGALWYQHECGKLLLRLEACGIWDGKQVHHESARLFPWVELSDSGKRSFHHSVVSFVILSHRSSLEPLVSTTLRGLIGTWLAEFHLRVEVTLL